MKKEVKLMLQAVEEAKKGKGRTSPNPLVGCVIERNGRIIGKGFHERFGAEHAEVNALRKAGKKVKGGTMYVSLEPCCFFGKTPPCTKAIIESGVKKVVIGSLDPNPLVKGKGVKELRRKGIKTKNLNLSEARKLNEFYFKFITKKIPFVLLKSAMSVDGFIADFKGKSKWISGKESRKLVHELRNEVDAVMVGIGTVKKDNPRLTCRIKGGRNPERVIIDPKLEFPLNAGMLKEKGKTIIVTAKKAGKKIKLIERKKNVSLLFLGEKKGVIDLRELMRELGRREIASVMIEGGSELNSRALNAGIVDRFLFFIAPIEIGKGIPVFSKKIIKRNSIKFRINSVKKIGEDLLVEAN